jgi:hypothetical protein
MLLAAGDDQSHSSFAPSTRVILLAIAAALVFPAAVLIAYLEPSSRKRVAPDEPGVEGSMPPSGSEPGQVVVPDDAPADAQHPGWTSPEPETRAVPEDGRGAGPRRRRLAWWIAALGLTVVGLTAWLVLARTSGGSRTGASSVGSSTGTSSVGSSTGDLLASLTIGACFNLSDTEWAVVPCTQPHDNQAYYRVTFPPGPFPGDPVVADAVMSTCDAHLDGYVGSGHAADFFDWPASPDQYEWAAGNQFTFCVLSRSDDGKLTGSAHQAH